MCFISVVIAFDPKGETAEVVTDRPASTCCLSVRPYRETVRDRAILGPSQNVVTHQKPVFIRIDRMRLYFHHRLASQGEDFPQPFAQKQMTITSIKKLADFSLTNKISTQSNIRFSLRFRRLAFLNSCRAVFSAPIRRAILK